MMDNMTDGMLGMGWMMGDMAVIWILILLVLGIAILALRRAEDTPPVVMPVLDTGTSRSPRLRSIAAQKVIAKQGVVDHRVKPGDDGVVMFRRKSHTNRA